MTKLKGILLTEGMHGMISQVEGLAKALDINYSHHTCLLYTSPSPRDVEEYRMPSSA